MFIPIGDTPNPRNFIPWVNWTLIGLNVVIYLFVSLPLTWKGVDTSDPLLLEYLKQLAPSVPNVGMLRQVVAQMSAYDLYIFAHGFKSGAPALGDLLYSMFLHGGFLHLAGNMLFLWIYGNNVEHTLGRLGYLTAYIATGAAATLVYALFAGSSMVPMVGASGAISGVLGLYFLLFPRNQVKLFIMFFPIFMDVVLLPARLVLGIYLVIDNLFPVLTGAESGVAYGAHIGGFAAGLLLAWGGERLAWRWPWQDRRQELNGSPEEPKEKELLMEDLDDDDMLAVLRAGMEAEDPDRVIWALARIGRHEMNELLPAECVRLAGWLNETGHSVAAVRLLRKCLSHHPTADGLAEVYLMLGLIRLDQDQATSAYQFLLSVFDHDPDPETAIQARQALAQIDAGSA